MNTCMHTCMHTCIHTHTHTHTQVCYAPHDNPGQTCVPLTATQMRALNVTAEAELTQAAGPGLTNVCNVSISLDTAYLYLENLPPPGAYRNPCATDQDCDYDGMEMMTNNDRRVQPHAMLQPDLCTRLQVNPNARTPRVQQRAVLQPQQRLRARILGIWLLDRQHMLLRRGRGRLASEFLFVSRLWLLLRWQLAWGNIWRVLIVSSLSRSRDRVTPLFYFQR